MCLKTGDNTARTLYMYIVYIYHLSSTVPFLLSSWLPLGRGPYLGCRAKIRTPACFTQQAEALLSELRRTLSELRRILTEPRCTLSELRRTLTEPRRTLTLFWIAGHTVITLWRDMEFCY